MQNPGLEETPERSSSLLTFCISAALVFYVPASFATFMAYNSALEAGTSLSMVSIDTLKGSTWTLYFFTLTILLYPPISYLIERKIGGFQLVDSGKWLTRKTYVSM